MSRVSELYGFGVTSVMESNWDIQCEDVPFSELCFKRISLAASGPWVQAEMDWSSEAPTVEMGQAWGEHRWRQER